MTLIQQAITVVWLHFLADFVMQTDEMATKKSNSLEWLIIHCGVYSLPLVAFGGFKYSVINTFLHFVTDFFTSRATSKLWKAGKRHWFFVVIGLDQAIHLTCLLLTLGFIT